MRHFDNQLRNEEPAFQMRVPDSGSTFCWQEEDDEKRLLEGFGNWNTVTEKAIESSEHGIRNAMRQAVDQQMTGYKDTTIYQQTIEHLDKKLKSQMEAAQVHVKHSLKCVHSQPSNFSSTWDERLKDRITTIKSELVEERHEAVPRPSKRSRKQGSTSGNGVVGQTSVQGGLWAKNIEAAAKASIYYEYEVDAHVNNVAKTLWSCVVEPLANENIQELYAFVTKSTIKND